VVAQKVGRWLMADQALIKKPVVKRCHLNVLPSQIEHFGLINEN